MSTHRALAVTTTAVLATTLITVGTADADRRHERRATAAGTLVYVKDHNIWLAGGDGSNARPLTSDGTATSPYTSPSQSDGGIIAAGRLDEIVRLDQSGHVLNTMDPAPLPSSVSGHPVDGNLTDVAISPDGSLIAYSMAKYLSPPGAESGYRTATGYTAATSLTDAATRGTTFYDQPSWAGNSRTLQSGGYGSQVMIDDLGPADPVHWFDDEDIVGHDIYTLSKDLGNTELSGDGRYVAAVRGYAEDSSITWYRTNGAAVPTLVCQLGPAAHVTDPTWGPDHDSLAWAAGDGIWVRAGAEDCSAPAQLLVPGGSQPDWSPAPLAPPTRPAAGKPVKNVKPPAISGKARVGKVLRATPGTWAPRPTKVSFRWKRNGKAIKGAAKRVYRIARPDRGKRISVTVTVARKGWKSTAATSRPVTVRR